MRIGYRRVSTIDQNLARQDLGDVDKVFEEKLSGANTKDRPALNDLMDFARQGDEVIIHSIDRMARDLRDCLNIVTTLNNKSVTVTFLSERLSFSGNEDDPFARLQLHLMSAFAAYELAILKHRQKAGIANAKAKGLYKGRPATTDVATIMAMHREGHGATHIARTMKVSRATVYRTLNTAGVNGGGDKQVNDTVATTE
jgi:DNA invertase Pin-like site-specific DNA recombinase